MQIKELNTLSEEAIRDIKELVEQCNNYDGLKGMIPLDVSFNFNKEMNTVFLLYEKEKLISALAIFAPGKNEAEISAMTLPEHRQKGYFTELVSRAEIEMKRYGVSDLLFVCLSGSERGKAAIAAQKANYEFTEYMLEYNHSMDQVIAQYDYRLMLQKATEEDLEQIIKISMEGFGDSYEGAKSLALGVLRAENRMMFLGKYQGNYVGMGSFALSDGEASIHGLTIMPEYQGKGFGKELLYGILDKLVEIKAEKILIDVDSENNGAFQLYQKSGFDIKNAWEYHRRAVK